MSWAERVAEQSPSVQRSRDRSIRQAEQLVQAARRLTIERGDQFTTQELAKEAGVAVQTFYRYFQSKDQLLLAVFENVMSESTAEQAEAAQHLDDPLERLHMHVRLAIESLGGHPHVGGARFTTSQHWRLQQLFPDEMVRAIQPFTDLIALALRDAKAAGTIDVQDVDVAATFVARVLRSTFHDYAYATTKPDLAELTAQVWAFCLSGVRATAAPPTT